MPTEQKKCEAPECEKEFTPTKPKQRFCSGNCRTYAHRAKNGQKTRRGTKGRIPGKKNTATKKSEPTEEQAPPSDLKGIDLMIWRENQKLKTQ